MSLVKSFSVGNGDMFYICHGNSNFSIIDCCIDEDNQEDIVKEIKTRSREKRITRFISSHPDQDHIKGLEYLNEETKIRNFYCVKNSVTKEDETIDFKKYCELRDSDKAFYIYRNCSRKWMNQGDSEIGSAGISILWPKVDNEHYKDALKNSEEGNSPNNISPIIRYSLDDGAKMIWMGDLETDFMEKIEDEIELPPIDILFAPHHGRKSGKVPKKFLEEMSPKIIIIGEADSQYINYYSGYDTITQNSAGHIVFDCKNNNVNIYVSKENFSVSFLNNLYLEDKYDCFYIGTLKLKH